MRNEALKLKIDFDRLHERVQDLPAHAWTPGWVLKNF